MGIASEYGTKILTTYHTLRVEAGLKRVLWGVNPFSIHTVIGGPLRVLSCLRVFLQGSPSFARIPGKDVSSSEQDTKVLVQDWPTEEFNMLMPQTSAWLIRQDLSIVTVCSGWLQ